MADILRLPRFSEDQNSAMVLRWLKKEGEEVKIGDALVEIETDKALMELDAKRNGFLLYIKVPVGEVQENDVLGIIGDEGEDVADILTAEQNRTAELIDKSRGVDVIRLPKLSDMMEEAKIVVWRVKEGDYIKKGDIIAEVETDKAIIEVESFREGKVLYRLDETKTIVKENEILIIVGEEGAYFKDLLELNKK